MCQNHDNFAHLHCHSEYSLLDGLSRVSDLVDRAVELGQPAVALTDHGAMYGVMDFYRSAKKAGIKPIIGIETYVAARGMTDRDSRLDKERFHLLMLAQNQAGYGNLLELASASQLEGYYYKPRVDHDFLAQYSDGIISTSGCLAGKVPQALMKGQDEDAYRLMGEYVDIFGPDRFFIELQEHSIPELTEVNKKLMEMAPKFGLENNYLLTNDVHYTLADDADPHQVLLCIQTGSTVQNPKMTFSDKGYYLKSYEEMYTLFQKMGYPDHVILNGLKNSLRITDMCDVSLDSDGYHLPLFEVPEEHDSATYLRHLCEEGLIWRYGADRAKNDPVLRQRLDHELGIIGRMGFETYFLIVWDLCEWAVRSDKWWEENQDPYPYSDYGEWKNNDIWWNVRGSGAGSVVAYTLGITSIDPLVNNLIFERFLNPGRVSMPDIDLDYPDDVRHWMVAYTKRRYGSEKVAQIITYGTMGARAAIRDVGRAMDIPLAEVDAIARLVPAVPGKPVKIKNCFDSEHEFYVRELLDRYKNDKIVKELLDTAQSLEGITRHASSHAAGVIVSDRPLHEYVPLNRPTSGNEGLGGVDRVTQWPMEIVESIGLLKVDFLGLSTLTVMRRAARLIEERYGTKYTMDNIPYDEGHVGPDPNKKPEKLFDMLGRGEVAGVFQVEGAGMKRLMMDMQPRRFDHIVAAISLYRPGPMENIPEYIRRMHGQSEVQFHHDALEPILGDTYGICVSGDALVTDTRTGERYRLDEIGSHQDFVIQGVDDQWQTTSGRVTHWIANGRKPVYQVTLQNGATIKVTADHRLLTESGWQPLNHLDVGDYIGTPPQLLGGHDTYSDRRRLRILAYLIADGSLASASSADFVSKDQNLIDEYVSCLSTFDDIRPSFTPQARGVMRVGAAKTDDSELSYHTPNALLEWLRDLGLKYKAGERPGGLRSHEKYIPSFIFRLCNDDIAYFLASLWECDGHMSRKTCHYKTISSRLAHDIQTLLLRLGISSAIYTHNYENPNRESRTSYQVTVFDTQNLAEQLQPYMVSEKREVVCVGNSSTTILREPFITELDATTTLSRRALMSEYAIDRQHFSPTARKRTRISANVVESVADALDLTATQQSARVNWQQIIAIEPVGEEEVYDLTVAGIHNFVANNIIVHNCVYQEQIIRIATALASYEPGEADMIRKAVSKKKKKLMEEHRIKFTDGAMNNGFSREVCDAIWGDIEFFARYGFNKAHAADYGKVTCQTAFLKAHYPVEYLAAMLSVERDNTEKVRRYFAEAKNLGIDVAPPDVNRSRLDFTIEDDGERPRIRFGLGAIKNAGANALSLIIDERVENGQFTDLQDLCDRVDLRRVGKRALEFMIRARAFDHWGSPPQMLDAMDRMVAESGRTHDAAAAGQMSLFGGLGAGPKLTVSLLRDESDLPKELRDAANDYKKTLEWEREALGVYVSEHPLERPLQMLEKLTSTTISEIDTHWNGKQVRLAGMISSLRPYTTKKGDPMAFSALEDLESKIDIVFFPRTWEAHRDEVKVDQVLLLWGKVNVKDESISIIVDKIDTKAQINMSADAELASYNTPYNPIPQWERTPPKEAFLNDAPDPQPLATAAQRLNPAPTAEIETEIEIEDSAPSTQHSTPSTQHAPPANGQQPAANRQSKIQNPKSKIPAPPPPFEDTWQTSNTFDGETESEMFVDENEQPAAHSQPPTANHQPIQNPKPKIQNGNGHTNGRAQLAERTTTYSDVRNRAQQVILVKIHMEGNWQEACQKSFNIATKFHGRDKFILRFVDQPYEIAFPQVNTLYCDDLVAQLQALPQVQRVDGIKA